MPQHSRKSTICPNCRKLISADEPRCPFCGMSRPGSRLVNNVWTRSWAEHGAWIKLLIYINVGMYGLSIFLLPQAANFHISPFTFLSPGIQSLLYLGATGVFSVDPSLFKYYTGIVPLDGHLRWWTLLSANYLHGSLIHLLFNMLAIRQLARLILREFGSHRTFIIYTVGGVTGFLISCLAGVRVTIGASAALCALIGAALYYGKSRGGTYGQMIYRQIGGWAIAIFLFGLLVPGINNWAHGGGLGAGILCAWLIGYHERTREQMLHKALSALCAITTLSALGWAIFSGFYYRLLG